MKVSVDDIVPGLENPLLPVPSQYLTTVGDAICSFVQWPKHLIILEEEKLPKVKKKECKKDTKWRSIIYQGTKSY